MQAVLQQQGLSSCQPTVSHHHHQPVVPRLAALPAVDWCKRDQRGAHVQTSAVAAPRTLPPRQKEEPPKDKELHKIFDEVFIHAKSGSGGRGEVVAHGKGRKVDNFKYKPGGSLPKRMFLPAAPPAQGADGASVVLRVDPDVDDLVHLHKRKEYTAKNGSNGDPALGSSGPQRFKGPRQNATSDLVISVPPGTLVKKKRSGQLLGELLVPGETLVVARGGIGGLGATAPPAKPPKKERVQDAQRRSKQLAAGIETIDVEDTNWTADTRGAPGEEVSLHLLLRMVADIGIVGLPNAGKSSLLACLTRASPQVAAYPFTTLKPNLGTLMVGAHGTRQPRPVLADLPGLIEGAHQGRGLGRMFLRHLRRTTGLLHVLDGAADDPLEDYRVVREELRLYNPEYCERPHVVAINKCDLFQSPADSSQLVDRLQGLAAQLQEASADNVTLPFAIVVASAEDGTGIQELQASTQQMLAQQHAARRKVAARVASNHGLDW